jgi:alpha-maltose-1-phosphate synthase
MITARCKETEYALAVLIVANSEYVLTTFIANGIPPAKIIAIPTLPTRRRRRRTERGRGRPPPGLYVGAMTLRKGFPYLLEAWRGLAPGARAHDV